MNNREINMAAVSEMFNFVPKTKSAIQKVNTEILKEIGRRLVLYSVVGNPALWRPPHWPKGYRPGHFINNWQVGIDLKPIGEIPGEDPSGGASLSRLVKLGRWTFGHIFHFSNNVKYAYALEYGHHSSQVGPQGIMGRVKAELPEIVRVAHQNYAYGKT